MSSTPASCSRSSSPPICTSEDEKAVPSPPSVDFEACLLGRAAARYAIEDGHLKDVATWRKIGERQIGRIQQPVGLRVVCRHLLESGPHHRSVGAHQLHVD